MSSTTRLAGLLQAFFSERLMTERRASPHTIASYRDTFCLLLRFARTRLGKRPSELALRDLDSGAIGAFLTHLEEDRGCSPRTRNARLAAIRCFFRYAAFKAPEHSAQIQRVLAIPNKRWGRKSVEYLTGQEAQALIKAPDQATWSGRRDHALLLLAVQTGLRVSEVVGLQCRDIAFGPGAHVRCRGKGRKERCTPLSKEAARCLRAWLGESGFSPEDPLFPNARGGPLSRDGVEYLLAKHIAAARRCCSSLRGKRVSPHVLRHTAAMNLLQHGVDCSVIALWLGHESVQTTQIYLHADLDLKQRVLAKTAPLNVPQRRYRPDDQLLAFLKSL